MMPILGGAIAAAAGSWVLGWTSAVVVGLSLGWFVPNGAAARRAGVAVAMGWAMVLAANAFLGPVPELARLLAAVIPVGAVGVLALTLAYGALLGLVAGWLGDELRRGLRPAGVTGTTPSESASASSTS